MIFQAFVAVALVALFIGGYCLGHAGGYQIGFDDGLVAPFHSEVPDD